MTATDGTTEPIELNGDEPPIVGITCQRLVAIEYSHAGVLVEPANVIFLQFSDRWYRLYFDYGTIFWRESASGPEGFAATELDATFLPVDLGKTFGVEQRRLVAIGYEAIPQGAEVRLRFESGPLLAFRCTKDVTSYQTDS
jgi:hypothetical protein